MKIRYILLAALTVILMMQASTMAFEDELQEEADYITNVCDGIWPDFKGLRPTCPDRFAYQP